MIMCGIVGYVGKKNAIKVIISGLETLEYRGYDSAGIAYRNVNNELKIIKETGKIVNLKEKLDFNEESHLGIGHTRWATHGEPNKVNSHPQKAGDITLVHNGIIENYESLKKCELLSGYSFESETDTEVACALIDALYKKEKENTIFSYICIVRCPLTNTFAVNDTKHCYEKFREPGQPDTTQYPILREKRSASPSVNTHLLNFQLAYSQCGYPGNLVNLVHSGDNRMGIRRRGQRSRREGGQRRIRVSARKSQVDTPPGPANIRGCGRRATCPSLLLP